MNDAYPSYEFLLDTLNNVLTRRSNLRMHSHTYFENEMTKVSIWKTEYTLDVLLYRKGQIMGRFNIFCGEYQIFDTYLIIDHKKRLMQIEDSVMVKKLQSYIKDIVFERYQKEEIDETIEMLRKESVKNRLRKELKK